MDKNLVKKADGHRLIEPFRSSMAHELNNPLMGILNFNQYALKKLPRDHPLHDIIEDAEKATKTCIEIVRNLLAFSRSDPADQEPFQAVDFMVMVDRVLKLLSYGRPLHRSGNYPWNTKNAVDNSLIFIKYREHVHLIYII